MNIIHTRDNKSPELQTAIVEPILIICVYGSSVSEISCKIQTMLSLSYTTIKNYLFYLMEYEVISYDGQKKIFTILDEGRNLLDKIDKKEKT